MVSNPQANDEAELGWATFPIPPAGLLIFDDRPLQVVGYRWQAKAIQDPNDPSVAFLNVICVAIAQPSSLVLAGEDALRMLPAAPGSKGN